MLGYFHRLRNDAGSRVSCHLEKNTFTIIYVVSTALVCLWHLKEFFCVYVALLLILFFRSLFHFLVPHTSVHASVFPSGTTTTPRLPRLRHSPSNPHTSVPRPDTHPSTKSPTTPTLIYLDTPDTPDSRTRRQYAYSTPSTPSTPRTSTTPTPIYISGASVRAPRMPSLPSLPRLPRLSTFPQPSLPTLPH